MDKYGELINCDELHYSKVTKDTEESYAAGTPAYLAPLAEISHQPTVNSNKRHYDGKVRYITTTESGTTVNITISGVPCSLAADLTGKPYDEDKGMVYDTGDISDAPWCTLSGRMELGDGGYRYYQYLKGKFTLGAQTAHTREDGITVNTATLTYEAAVTEHKFQVKTGKLSGAKAVTADTTDEKFTAAAQAAWFTKVQTPPEPASGQSTQAAENTKAVKS